MKMSLSASTLVNRLLRPRHSLLHVQHRGLTTRRQPKAVRSFVHEHSHPKRLPRHAQHHPAHKTSLDHNAFSFSGAGWASAFHLGVVYALQEYGYFTQHGLSKHEHSDRISKEEMVHSDNTDVYKHVSEREFSHKHQSKFTPAYPYLAGASGGALTAVWIACGLPVKHMMESARHMGDYCNDNNGIYGNLAPVLREMLMRELPDDAHIRCSGVVGIHVLRIWPNPSSESLVIDQFGTKEELISAALASCHIPGYLHRGRPYHEHKGEKLVDGGLLKIVPSLPKNLNGVHVCVLPSEYAIGCEVDICPNKVPRETWAGRSVFRYAYNMLMPPEDLKAYGDELFERGYEAGQQWVVHGAPTHRNGNTQ
ncbi:hypothetical protein SARC_01799 [Sphaeroforma arctica JP610]|uniref:PNPLA domain-containing protein n=1 Tax=Sphaeroforma arctica JP610 TaxID=667725 RepID=A0A0L0GAM3_9EUKA|nr:hypothetical protein SARC_01799 [Sphaeroforma arctica JP610]KNC86040.1 hypothetical protein SARC_01799 [Sphaeroforma arctica JP610]|eukprot:XP_014159942.1 hypothetical protein SARC_01799 [Sphaeroforma arctica JP610]